MTKRQIELLIESVSYHQLHLQKMYGQVTNEKILEQLLHEHLELCEISKMLIKELDKYDNYSYLEDNNGGFLIFTKDLDYFKSLEGVAFFNLHECGRGSLDEIEKAFGKFYHILLKSDTCLYEIKPII